MTVQPKLLNLSVYIDDHLDGDLSLTKLSARMKLSPFHFHRKFRDYYGDSLHQHIKRLRLERAAWELLQHNKPVKAIALSSGYRTVSAFSHAFSLYAGVPPTQYRDLLQNGAHVQARRALQRKFSEEFLAHLKPARIAVVKERGVAFLRTTAVGRTALAEARVAADQLREASGPVTEWTAALIDIPGITDGATFRIELGVDASRLTPKVRSQFGARTLAAGRYARFDLRGKYTELLDIINAIELLWLPSSGERSRPAPSYAVFKGEVTGELECNFFFPVE